MKKSEYFITNDERRTKMQPMGLPDSVTLAPGTCLSNAEDDEPIFILRAKDPIAADIVDIWAMLAVKHHEFEKMQSAQQLAVDMRKWFIAYAERELAK